MLEKRTGTRVPDAMRRVISSASAMVHKSLSGPDFAEEYVSDLRWRSKLRVRGLSSMFVVGLELELCSNLEFSWGTCLS
jgi:hypothetical protein